MGVSKIHLYIVLSLYHKIISLSTVIKIRFNDAVSGTEFWFGFPTNLWSDLRWHSTLGKLVQWAPWRWSIVIVFWLVVGRKRRVAVGHSGKATPNLVELKSLSGHLLCLALALPKTRPDAFHLIYSHSHCLFSMSNK